MKKGYAGGLVVSAADREHIGLLGVQAPMMQVSASLSWPGCPWTAWQGQRLTPAFAGADVRRFDVKDMRRAFQEGIPDRGSGWGCRRIST
jgi:hypothetical protein